MACATREIARATLVGLEHAVSIVSFTLLRQCIFEYSAFQNFLFAKNVLIKISLLYTRNPLVESFV